MSATVIAIDGPAASGKSTVAKNLAKKLGILYVSTGSLYRAIAWKAIRNGIGTKDEKALEKMLEQTDLHYAKNSAGELDIEIDGVFPGQELRAAEIALGASDVATVPLVRAWTLDIQRDTAKENWIVMEGRDIGTVVFPDAKYKFFLTASPEERAKRRLLQDGFELDPELLQKTAAAIAERDRVDSTRAVSPLKQADDATLVDSSDLSKEETVQRILMLIREKQNG